MALGRELSIIHEAQGPVARSMVNVNQLLIP